MSDRICEDSVTLPLNLIPTLTQSTTANVVIIIIIMIIILIIIPTLTQSTMENVVIRRGGGFTSSPLPDPSPLSTYMHNKLCTYREINNNSVPDGFAWNNSELVLELGW